MKIVKSPILLQKEQELKGLEKKHKKTMTQVRKNRTQLKNMHEEIERLQQQASGGIFMGMLDVKKLKDELIALIKKAIKLKKLSQDDKEILKEIHNTFMGEASFFDDMPFDWEELEEMKKKNERGFENTDEFDRQRVRNFFAQFQVEPDKEEQKEVRKIYIRLANRFHPDKAKNDAEREFYHDMMQKIVLANDQGDFEMLQSIETEYADSTQGIPTDMTQASVVLDLMDEQIARMRNNLQQLEKQLARLKLEVSNLKKSELGKMLKQERESQRYGGVSTEDAVSGVSEMKDHLEELKEDLEYLIKHKKFSQRFYDSLDAMQTDVSDLDDLFGNFMFDDDDDEYDDDDNDEIDGGFSYDEKTGKFFSPNYSKQNLANLNRNNQMDDDPFNMPPAFQEMIQKAASGELSEEDLRNQLNDMLRQFK